MGKNKKIRPLQSYHEFTVRSDWERHRDQRYRDYRKLWSELPKQQELSGFPLHLDIETTTLCNLKCPMCPRTVALMKGEFDSSHRIALDDFNDVIDQGASSGLYSIKLNYLGEPLMHPDVVEQVRYAKQQGIVDVMFNTNGTLLSREKSEQLLDAGLDKLFLSFDSPYPDKYEEIRVGAKFDEVMENIRYFYRLKTERYPHVQVRASMVMLHDAQKSQEDFIALFQDTVDAIGFDEYRETEDRSVKPAIEGFVCAQLYQRMFLRASGDVIVCCADERGEYVVGNWKRQQLKDIWHGEPYMSLRRAHAEGRYHDVPMCARCTVPLAQEAAFEREAGQRG